MKSVVLAAALMTLSSISEARICRAILLQPDLDICIAKDQILDQLPDEAWNDLVCEAQRFDLDVHTFRRDPSSFNLVSFNELGDCEWEVRANSGSN